ncbi:hypothetical protein AB2L27_00520 [Kineococcus sp. LSe6-4]|uniref:Uncharacterized protein n=1 Tax=Kineococcus halophytocola TaxID=3234027 RepID=A0ABV4GVA2_9ACTN
MNPADLQRRLDSAALAPEEATNADWARNVALVRSRTRQRRVRGVVVAALAAAAAVVVAVTWQPAGPVVRVEPAAPDPTAPRLVAPGTLSSVAQTCARTVGEDDDVTPVFGGRTDAVEAVLYRLQDGRLHFCSRLGGALVDGPVAPNGTAAGPVRNSAMGGTTVTEAGDTMVSAFGFLPPTATRVVVSAPGRSAVALTSGGYWWTTLLVGRDQFADVTWTATDASGSVVAEGGLS